jgi:hypothetical protein
MASIVQKASEPRPRRLRGWWLRQLHTWHWVSAAISLCGMALFALTGLTLNHAASIAADPQVAQKQATLPQAFVSALAQTRSTNAVLPPAVADEVEKAVGLDVHNRPAEWSDQDVYIALPRPGGDAWVSIDRTSGQIESEVTNRGWISFFNDLHKGRNAGTAWFWFIDAFAVACIIFTLSGLLLLQLHARHRPMTWPLVIVGLVVPALMTLFFLH